MEKLLSGHSKRGGLGGSFLYCEYPAVSAADIFSGCLWRNFMSDVIAAISTALSPSGIGIVRMSGEGAMEVPIRSIMDILRMMIRLWMKYWLCG